MSSSLVRLTVIGYVLVLSLALGLLLLPKSLQAQKGFGVSTGYRATPALPTIAIPMITASNGGFGAVGGGGVLGAGGQAGGGNVSGSVSTQIVTVNLGQFFPNNGQIIGLPPPTMQPMLNNFFYGPLSGDSTTAPWALITSLGSGGGGGGAAGGLGGAGGGVGGFGGGIAGGAGGQGGGGIGGFAGKGMGGFNGKKAL